MSELSDTDLTESQAKQRIQDMRTAFTDFQTYLRQQIEQERAEATEMRKTLSKVTELQTLLMTLQKAEDVFLEKFRSELRNERDYDHLRAAIGGKLDRLRNSDNPELVFRRSDAG